MSTVAFLASVVDPRVASAAAKSALGKSELLMSAGFGIEYFIIEIPSECNEHKNLVILMEPNCWLNKVLRSFDSGQPTNPA